MPLYSRLKQDYINFFLQATLSLYLKLASKIWCHFVLNLRRYDTISAHVQKTCMAICFRKTSVYRNGFYISVCNSRYIVSVSLCLVTFSRRQIVLSRKVWHFVVAYMWRKFWSYLHSYLNSPRNKKKHIKVIGSPYLIPVDIFHQETEK